MKVHSILVSVLILIVFIPFAFADSTPDWVKNTAGWWATDAISDTEFINAVEFLIDVGIINISNECKFENKEFSHITEFGKMILCKKIDMTFLDEIVLSEKKNEELRINKFGFRGDDFSVETHDSSYRVFMLGGSTMFGHGATSDKTTIPGYLQEFFQDDYGEYNIEIINSGIQGADSFDELNLIKTRLLDYSPDMMVIYDGWNDLRENNSSETIYDNWNSMCELGKENGVDAYHNLLGLKDTSKTFTEILKEDGYFTCCDLLHENVISKRGFDIHQAHDEYNDDLEVKHSDLITDAVKKHLDNYLHKRSWLIY